MHAGRIIWWCQDEYHVVRSALYELGVLDKHIALSEVCYIASSIPCIHMLDPQLASLLVISVSPALHTLLYLQGFLQWLVSELNHKTSDARLFRGL